MSPARVIYTCSGQGKIFRNNSQRLAADNPSPGIPTPIKWLNDKVKDTKYQHKVLIGIEGTIQTMVTLMKRKVKKWNLDNLFGEQIENWE